MISQDDKLLKITIELEKKYPFFRKRDVYSSVSDSHRKVRRVFKLLSDKEFEEIKRIADLDLGHS